MEKLVAVQVPPEYVVITSFAGEGRLYDFAVCPKDLAPFARNTQSVMDGEWRSHAGLQITLGLHPSDAEHRTCAVPRPFPHPPLPRRAPDPS
eukprot:9502113-Pyramimonas_sp.AAC.1